MIARILRPPFTIRRSSLVLGTVVAGLAFPAASMAKAPICTKHNTKQPTCQIATSPIHKGSHGFMLSLKIDEGQLTGYGGRYPASVGGTLVKTTDGGHATETDTYSFSSTRSHKLTFSGNLSSASMNGTFANGRGSIHLTFHATGKATHVTVPKGCTSDTGINTGTRRTGKISGTYTLHADKLGTITQKVFKKATISSVFWSCNPRTHGYEVQTPTGSPFVDVFMGPKGKVSEEIEHQTSGSGWAFDNGYTVRDQPSSVYTLNKSKLNTASVKGAGAITGTAKYTSSHSSSHQTSGKMSGTLAVTLAAIGKVTAFPAPRNATQNHT